LASRNIIKHKLSSLFLLKEREEKEEKLGSALITKKKKKKALRYLLWVLRASSTVDYNNSSRVRRFVSRIELGLLGISHKKGGFLVS
jgi:hypothetical protein